MNPAGLIRAFVRHKVAANILMLLLVFIGLFAMGRLNTQLNPDTQGDGINVFIAWPGASADDIDRGIVEAVLPEVRFLTGVDEVNARSREGIAEIFIAYDEGTNMAEALSQVESAVASVTTLPQESEDPVIRRAENIEPIMEVVISGPLPEASLRTFAKKIRDDLLARGIDRVEVTGLRDTEIWVEVPAHELQRLDMTLTEVARRISGSSQDVPSGSLSGGVEKQVRALGQQEEAEGIADLSVKMNADGTRLTLGDIAGVRETFEDGAVAGRRDGNPALQIGLYRTANGGDLLQMTNRVNDYLAELTPTLPPTLKLEVTNRISEYLSDRIWLLVSNGLSGLLLVVGILWLFLRPRITLWVAVGIPVSLAAAFGVMLVLGQSINMLSLFALIMVLGIIVDDAIVVAEHAQTMHEKGLSPDKAAEVGAKRMFWPVVAASLTTVAAFAPMLLIGGQAGAFISAIPLVAVAVILASLLECFAILPSHLKHALAKDNGRSSRFRLWFDRNFKAFRDGPLHRWVEIAAHHRYATMAVAIGLLVFTMGLQGSGRVPFAFFPNPEGQWMTFNAVFSPGTPRETVAAQLDEAQAALERVEAKLGYEPGGLVVMAFGQLGSTNGNQIAPQIGDYVGASSVELIPADQRDDRLPDIRRMWEEETKLLPGIDEAIFAAEQVGFGGSFIGWRLTHDDPYVLKQASLELQRVMATYTGVSATRDNLPVGRPELVVRLTPRGEALGFTTESVGRQLRDALDGAVAKRFARGDEEITVRVRLPEEDQSEQALRNLVLRSPTGTEVPLAEVVELTERPGLSRIWREKGQRVVSVSADVDERGGITANEIREAIEKEHLPRILETYGVSKMQGSFAEIEAEFFASFMNNVLLALAAIYLILAWILGSYSKPISVMMIIPFGLAGSVMGHWLMGYPMTMFSYIALMGLAGILVNDSILLVETVRDKQDEGMPLREAVVEASRMRLRPVLLTSLTTIGGLLPLMFETNLQAQFLVPMAITLVFGLGVATALVLVLVPSLLLIVDDFRRLFVRTWRWFVRNPDLPRVSTAGDD